MVFQSSLASDALHGGAAGHTRDSSYVVLDETNERILHLLAHRGRSPMSALAGAVGRTESTVRERVATLQRRGIILGYEARIDWALAGFPLLVLIDAYCPPGLAGEVATRLQHIPNVVQAGITTGSPNVWASIRARDTSDVRKQLGLLASTPLVNVHARITVEQLVTERPPLAALAAAPSGGLPPYDPLAARPIGTRRLAIHHGKVEEALVHAHA
jgi:Lrp/AsnC family leucine-responsive transcriptional regulator